MNIADKICELRAGKGMIRKAFAEHIGISFRTVEDCETGKHTSPDYIPRLISCIIRIFMSVLYKMKARQICLCSWRNKNPEDHNSLKEEKLENLYMK